MDDFAEVLMPSYEQLSIRDCLPNEDRGHYVSYGHIGTPFQLEVVFTTKKITIKKLMIRADFQRQGLGRKIVDYLKRECTRLFICEIELEGILLESTGFWEKCGFSINGSYGRWEVHES